MPRIRTTTTAPSTRFRLDTLRARAALDSRTTNDGGKTVCSAGCPAA